MSDQGDISAYSMPQNLRNVHVKTKLQLQAGHKKKLPCKKGACFMSFGTNSSLLQAALLVAGSMGEQK